jgi:hypothetical protein
MAPLDRQSFIRDPFHLLFKINWYYFLSTINLDVWTRFQFRRRIRRPRTGRKRRRIHRNERCATVHPRDLNNLTLRYRIFGKSSSANLVQTALDLKSEYSGTEGEQMCMHMHMVNRRPEFWTPHSVSRTPLLLSFAQLTGVFKLIVGMRYSSRRHRRHRLHVPRAGPNRLA